MSAAPALWTKHRAIAHACANQYWLPGADRDDVHQEALIALWEAARAYDRELGCTFPTFARIVIKRRLTDALRTARSHRHMLLTDSERLSEHTTQAAISEDREQLRALVSGFQQLSLLEQDAVRGAANGVPYRGNKRVDNALQRARRKLRAA